jgi:hypothetical protein
MNSQRKPSRWSKSFAISFLPVVLALCAFAFDASAQLRIPAFAAYLEPLDSENGRARVSEKRGITGWTDPAQKIVWFGELKKTGPLGCSVVLRLPDGAKSRLRLTVGEQSREATVQGAGSSEVTARFDPFEISTGASQKFTKFTLQSLNSPGEDSGAIEALLLDGPAARDAHFNTRERRNAASVHLRYPTAETNVSAFYCEVTGIEAPVWTYFMACGWHRGYFGMQVNSPSERRIIFSVWDSGNEGVDRQKVASENRVTLVAKGEGVFTGDFGNEGTGGHSHLIYDWKTGERQRFLVTARPVDATHTIYAGYYFHPDRQKWMLISAWNTPRDGGYLRSLYSFSENFVGDNGQLRRKALYGNQWIQTSDNQWHELTNAVFSHDPTGRADRLDRFMGVENGEFYLSQGGFIPGFTKSGEKFSRTPNGNAPADIRLPPLP